MRARVFGIQALNELLAGPTLFTSHQTVGETPCSSGAWPQYSAAVNTQTRTHALAYTRCKRKRYRNAILATEEEKQREVRLCSHAAANGESRRNVCVCLKPKCIRVRLFIIHVAHASVGM